MSRSLILSSSLAVGLSLVSAPTVPAVAEAGEVEVTYLANEGFLVAAGETRVLIDALFGDGFAGYPAVPPEIRKRLETGGDEFAGVDLVLASHHHGDHLDARAVGLFLARNPGSRFVSTEQAAERVRRWAKDPQWRVFGLWPEEGKRATVEDDDGLRVTALRLHHGEAEAQNLGFLVEIAGLRLIHLGDTEVTAEELRPLGLRREGIDVALVPYWYVDTPRLRPALDELGARHVVVMHLAAPGAPEPYFEGAGSLKGQVEKIRAELPAAWVPLEPLESRRFQPSLDLEHVAIP